MNNLFTHEKIYQTNIFLEFKNARIESRFRQDQHSQSLHALIGYLVLSIITVTFQFMDSTCFRYSVNCKLEWLTIITLISTMSSLILVHQKKDRHLVRCLLMIISLYHHLNILDRFDYTAGLVLVVAETTISTMLIFDCWKYHLVYNTMSYILLFWGINYWDMRQVFHKEGNEITQDFFIFHALATIGIAFLERSSREKWVLLDSIKRSEKVFQKLFEDAPLPSIVIDANKSIILSNRKGIELISKIDRRLVVSDLSKNSSPSLSLLQRTNFISLIDIDYQEAVNAALNGLGSDNKASIRIALKKGKDLSNTYKLSRTETLLSNFSLTDGPKNKEWEDYGPFCDLEISEFIWRGKRSYLLTIKDTNASIRNHDVLVKRLNKVVNDLEESIFNLESDYDNISNYLKKMGNENLAQPLAKLIMKLNVLKNSVLNTHTLNTFISGFGKPQFLHSEFNLKQFTIYLLELFSVQTLQNKIQVNLSFGNGFPEYVSSDPSLFQQVFGNVLKNIVENSRDVTIDIACGVRNVLAGGVMLMEFKFESEKTEFFNERNIKNAINYLSNEPADDFIARLLKAPDFGIEVGLIPMILKETEGGIEVTENNNVEGGRVTVTLVIPMPHHLPEDINGIEKLTENISKLNLTNTRSVVNQNKITWKREIIVEIKSFRSENSDFSCESGSLTQKSIAKSINSLKSDKSYRENSTDASSNSSRSDKNLTFAEFQEKKQKQISDAKSPVPTKRTTENSKIKGARQELLGLINKKNQLTKIQENISESEDSFKILAPVKKANTDDFDDLRSSVHAQFISKNHDREREEPLNFSRINSTVSGTGLSFPMDFASPESFKIVSNFNVPTFDEQLVKTIITFSLIEILSKLPPSSSLKRKKRDLDNPSSDNEIDRSASPPDMSPLSR